MTATATDNLLLAASEVAIEAAGGERKLPRISMLAYGGGVMFVPGWGDIAIDLAGLDAGGQVPLLADHDARVGGAVGHGTADVRDGRLFVTGVVSGAGAAARQIVEMAAGGFQFQASVGVQPDEHERVWPGAVIAPGLHAREARATAGSEHHRDRGGPEHDRRHRGGKKKGSEHHGHGSPTDRRERHPRRRARTVEPD